MKKLILVTLFLVSAVVKAESNFVVVQLPKAVTLEVPRNWEAFDNNKLITLDAYVEASGKKLTESSLPFAANLYDADGKTLALVNVRFYPENKLTQENCYALSNENVSQIDAEIKKSQLASFHEYGVTNLVFDKTKKKIKNGICLIQHANTFTVPENGKKVKEIRARIWASPRSFTVTVSYNLKQEHLLKPIVEYIIDSVRLEKVN